MSLPVVLVNIYAGKAVSHLAPVVVRYDFQVVALVAFFHHLEERLRIVE